jgi:hypothetical protein
MKERLKKLGWGSLIYIVLIYFTIDTSYSHKYSGTDYLFLLIGSTLFSFLVYHTIRNNLKKKYKNPYLSSALSGLLSWIITVVVVAQISRV